MTPVVFIHWGDYYSYLQLSLEQADRFGNNVFYVKGRQPIKYSMEVDRWFMLRDFMENFELERVAYFDSDVLLYKNVDEDFRDCDMAFSKSHSGHNMFVNNIKALDDFCYFIEWNINNVDLVSKCRQRLPEHIFADTVGDMVLLNNFMFQTNYFFRDTAKIIDNSVYDHNINTSDGFDTFLGYKYFQWDRQTPYVEKNGEVIRFNSIHFQGAAKPLMKGFCR